MKTYNLKESLIRMDRETDFKYTLTDLYEACRLSEEKKAELAQYIDNKDPAGMAKMLSNEAGIMAENVSDDLADSEMPEGWSPNLVDCPECGDTSFDSKKGRCTKCSYRESLNESWLDVYQQFMAVVDDLYVGGNEEEVSKAVEELYRKHQGERDWDNAWLRWLEPSGEPDDPLYADQEAFWRAEMIRINGNPSYLRREELQESADEEDYSIYNLTPEQVEKVKFIRQNLNKPAGYRAYYELMKEIHDNGGCEDIFYDLSPDFYWDAQLSVALTKLALADNRPDLADPDFLPGGECADYLDHPNYANILKEDFDAQGLQNKLRAAAEKKLADMGYDEAFTYDYFGIKLTDTDDNRIKVTVWGELSYEESSELADVLNPIVAEEDPDAYFDHETSGRMAAYIRKDQSEDIPDEAMVAEWSEKFNNCTTWEQLKDVYGEFYNVRDGLNNGTHRALYDIIDKKIDELKPAQEALEEEYKVKFFQVFEAPKTPKEDGKMIGQRGTLEDANKCGKEKVGEGNYIIKAVCTDGKTRPIDNDTSEDAYQMEESLTEDAEKKLIKSLINGDIWRIDQENVVPNTNSFIATCVKGDCEGYTWTFIEADKRGNAYLSTKGLDDFKFTLSPDDDDYDLPTEIMEIDGRDSVYYITSDDFEEFKRPLKEDVEDEVITRKYLFDPNDWVGNPTDLEDYFEYTPEEITFIPNTIEEGQPTVITLKGIKHYLDDFASKYGDFLPDEAIDDHLDKSYWKGLSDESLIDWWNRASKGAGPEAQYDDEIFDELCARGLMDSQGELKAESLKEAIHNSPRSRLNEAILKDIDSANRSSLKETLTEKIDVWEIEYNDGALQRCQVPNETTTVKGTWMDVLDELDAMYVDIPGDRDEDDMPTCPLEQFISEYESYADFSGSNVVLAIKKNGKVVYQISDYDAFCDDSYDESLKESNQFRDDNGKVNASKWYASKYPDDSVGIEQLDGLYLDDLLKDRKGIDHCDTQVRDRVNQQLDRYIPIKEDVQNTPVKLASEYFYDTIKNIQDAGWSEILSFAEDSGWISGSNIIIPAGTVMTLVDQNRHYDVYWVKTSAGDEFIPFNKDFTAESPLSFEDPAAEGANAYNVTFYMDSLDDNVMSGPHTTQKIYANSEEEAKKKLMDSSTDKYYIPTIVKVELVESVETSKEWEHKDKDGKIGRIRQSDGKGDRKPLTRDQAKEIAKFRGHEDDELYPVNEAMTYTDTNGFLGDPGETYTMSQFRRMWQDKDNDPVMSGYDSFEEWVGETISQMDAHEDDSIDVAPSGRGKLSTAIFIDTNGVMGTSGGKFTLNDLADYWEANRGSDPVLANYNGDWKKWLDDTIEQMEVSYDSSLYEESLTESKSMNEDLSSITSLADDCGKNTFKKSARDVRFTFEDEKSASKFMNKLKEKNIHYDELSMGVIKVSKSAALDESFEDMLKDPEVQRRNAEYADRMKAKHDKENELAKEAKNWPDDKVLTYEEALALAKAYYSQGGDGFYETADEGYFNLLVQEFGPQTVKSMKQEFGVFDSVAKDRMTEEAQDNLNCKVFKNKQEAQQFAKEHKGYFEVTTDDDLNDEFHVFYKADLKEDFDSSYSVYDCVKLENDMWVIITGVSANGYTGITENDILDGYFEEIEFEPDEIKWGIDAEYLGQERFEKEVLPLIDKVKENQSSSIKEYYEPERNERLSTSNIIKALKAHSVDYKEKDGKVIAIDVYTKDGETFEDEVDLTNCTYQQLRDFLGY